MVESSMAMSLDTIVDVNTEGEQIPLSRVLDARTEMQDWLKAKLTTGVCAEHLVCELAGHWCRMPQMFGAVPLLIDCHAVLDQIGSLEKIPRNRAARTKPATEFPTGPLKGLWHKHWFQASFIPTNLLLENEKNGDALLYRALAKRYGRKGWQGKAVGDAAGAIAHAAVFDALDWRAGSQSKTSSSRLTGEWIVFAKCAGRNIYLTLASHAESNEAILARCRSAVADFAELRETLPFSEL